MGLIPKKAIDRVQFYETHIGLFVSNATSIGISAAEATALQTQIEAARAAYSAQQDAKHTAELATADFQSALDAMSSAGAAVIKKIRGQAELTGPSVYTLAGIPGPTTPTSVGAPGMPYQYEATLKPNGALDMKWRCDNPKNCNNVIYQIYRKVDETGEYSYLGGAGQRNFIDNTVPTGVSSITYQIQGTRSTAIGDAAFFTVQFGVGGVTVSAVKPVKVAA